MSSKLLWLSLALLLSCTPLVAQEEKVVYSLPFKGTCPIGQTTANPNHTAARVYAVDFAMPRGCPIYACREGVVAQIHNAEEEGVKGNKTQILIITHADKTQGCYENLAVGSPLVKKGDNVRRGQLLACSDGKGLHFHVRSGTAMPYSPVQIEFLTSDAPSSILEAGKFYTNPQD